MSARFVRLTGTHGRPVDIAVAHIVSIEVESAGGVFLAAGRTSYGVAESREEVLALLAEPAPSPSVEVTEAAVEAANDAWFADVPWRGQGSERDCRMMMRAAIEAADRARGLRR